MFPGQTRRRQSFDQLHIGGYGMAEQVLQNVRHSGAWLPDSNAMDIADGNALHSHANQGAPRVNLIRCGYVAA